MVWGDSDRVVVGGEVGHRPYLRPLSMSGIILDRKKKKPAVPPWFRGRPGDGMRAEKKRKKIKKKKKKIAPIVEAVFDRFCMQAGNVHNRDAVLILPRKICGQRARQRNEQGAHGHGVHRLKEIFLAWGRFVFFQIPPI